MCFTIKHFRDGVPVGVPDRAITMYAARCHARLRGNELDSSVAIILGKSDREEQKEVEVINFAH